MLTKLGQFWRKFVGLVCALSFVYLCIDLWLIRNMAGYRSPVQPRSKRLGPNFRNTKGSQGIRRRLRFVFWRFCFLPANLKGKDVPRLLTEREWTTRKTTNAIFTLSQLMRARYCVWLSSLINSGTSWNWNLLWNLTPGRCKGYSTLQDVNHS